MNKKIFIIEHLDNEISNWSKIGYEEISKIIGKNKLWFTNILKNDVKKVKKFGKVFLNSVRSMNLDSVCVLDPQAKSTLTPTTANKFKYFIIGGILGDNPPRNRTNDELTQVIKNAKAYNIGKKQFSTDNAVLVVSEIIKGKKLKELKFIDKSEIKIDEIQSTILPYRYPIINCKPHICQKLINFIKKQDKV